MPDTAYSDPPGMPQDERMSPAELKVVREFLGFSVPALAARMRVSERTVRFWEEGRYAIPDGVRLEIEALERMTGAFIGRAVEALNTVRDPAVVTYASDAEYRAAHSEVDLPASWHRAVVARVALEVPGLVIAYARDVEGDVAEYADLVAR